MSEPDEMKEIKEIYSQYIIDPADFKMIKTLGKGGYSEVWLVSYKDSDNVAALKQLYSDPTPRQFRQFAREIQTMTEVDHPFFVKMLGFSPAKPLSLLSEYIPNGSLYEFYNSRQNRGRLTNTKRTLIAMGIASAMSSLHKAGIIHRDLKSMNILLDESLLPRLCDFGIARFNNTDEINTMRLGTPHWMAPETLDGDSGYSYPVDVYAFGMVMYELLTFQIPWKNMDQLSVTKAVVFEKRRPELPMLAPKSLKDLITRCWETEPEKRPTFNEIYRSFASGKVFFADTDHEEVAKLDKRLVEFHLSINRKGAVPNILDRMCPISQTRTRRTDRLSLGTSDNNNAMIVEGLIYYSSDIENKLPYFIRDEDCAKISTSYINSTEVCLSTSLERAELDVPDSPGYRSTIHTNEIEGHDSVIDCPNESKDCGFSKEILSDINDPQFEAELMKVVSNIDEHDVRKFFNIIRRHFTDKTPEDEFEFIISSLRSVIHKPQVSAQFSWWKLQYHLPLKNEKLFRSVLDFLYVAFSYSPSIFQDNFDQEFMYIVQRDTESALVLLQLTAKKFNELTNPWTLLDFLFNEYEYFLSSTAVSEYLSTVFYLCEKYEDFREYRLDAAIELYITALSTENRSAVDIAYNALHHYKVKPSSINQAVLCEHLKDEKLCPKVVQLLLNLKIIYSKDLIEAIIESAGYCSSSCLLLSIIADDHRYAEYLSKSTLWIDQELPTLLDTFRIFLNVFSHVELRENLAKSNEVYRLLRSISLEDNPQLSKYLYHIIVRFPSSDKIIVQLSEFGVLNGIIQSSLKLGNESAIHSMLKIIDFCAFSVYTPDYLLVADKLKQMLKSYGKSHFLIVKLISILSSYEECAEKLNDPKLERYFREKLKDNDDYKEYRELYLKNMDQLNGN